MLLIAACDQRLRRPDPALLGRGVPIFGTIPLIRGDAPEGQPSGDLMALSIHEVRALLEIRAKSTGARSFAITSPSQGAGKTSLTVGLAASLALSGTKTLLVDCELVSRILKSASGGGGGTGDPGNSGAQSLDEVMCQMGYLDEHDAEVLQVADDGSVGLIAALEGRPLAQCVIETSIPGLSILPTVRPAAKHVGMLSCRFIADLIAQARGTYDMVLFDTGPIPGSVEALCVVAEVDGVILVASNGELQSRFDRTRSHLRLVGATLVGTVFNRTEEADLTLRAGRNGPDFNAAARRAGGVAKRLGSGAARSYGSGIIAAAVYAQPQRPLALGERAGEGTPGWTTPSKPQLNPPAAAPTPAAPSAPRGHGAADADDETLSARDAGSITDILRGEPESSVDAPDVAPADFEPADADAQTVAHALRGDPDPDPLPPPEGAPKTPLGEGAQRSDLVDDAIDEALDQLVRDAAQAARPPRPAGAK